LKGALDFPQWLSTEHCVKKRCVFLKAVCYDSALSGTMQ